MRKPGRYDITIPQRADVRLRLRLTTIPDGGEVADRVPIDATGYELTAQCWHWDRSVMYGVFTVEWIDQSEGLFDLVMSAAQTMAVQDCHWDLLVSVPGGEQEYWLEGRVTVDRGLSAPLPVIP